MLPYKLFFIFIAILILLIPGCRSVGNKEVQINEISANALPSQTVDASTDFMNNYRVPNPVPQPVKGKGSVIGQIETDNLIELRGMIIYLGEIIVIDQNEYGGFLNTDKAPSTIIDLSNGKFFFHGIDPGIYSLILYDVGDGGRALTDSTGSVIRIFVEPEKITDIEKVQFSHP